MNAVELEDDLYFFTEIRKAEDVLLKSESKYRSYMEESPIGIFVVDSETHYIEVNRKACQISGYAENELLNLTINDFVASEYLELGLKIFEKQ